MRILDRYIAKSLLQIFFSCIFLFIFLYTIIDVLSNLEDILKMDATIYTHVYYYLLQAPIMFGRIAPFACLLSALFAFGSLNHNNEIIAMRSSGLSIYQVIKTALILGVVVSAFTFWINDRFVPRALSTSQEMRAEMEKKSAKKDKGHEEVINLAMYGLKNRLFFINKFLPGSNTMEGITILEQDEKQNLTRKIVANRGVYENGVWKFYQCITYNFDKNGQIIQEPQYMEEEIMNITETPRDFLAQRQRTEYMDIAQLDNYIWKLSKSGAGTIVRNLKLELYQRFTSPLNSIIIIFLGVPFALKMRRKATGISSIAIAIAVSFLYYIFDAVSIAFGRGGIIPPAAAASLSHLLALSAGLYLIHELP